MANRDINRMLPRHFNMARMIAAGFTHRETSEVLGCSRENVSVVARSPIFLTEVNRMIRERNDQSVNDDIEAFESKARIVLDQNVEKAALTQVDLLEAEDDSVRLRASGSILDRVLGKADEKTPAAVAIHVDSATINLLTLALKESTNATRQESGTDEKRHSGSSENGYSDVRQTTTFSSGVGHRETQAQDRTEIVEVGKS